VARDEYRFSHPLRVRWAEVDRQGVVFNAHYLAYFDVGITEYWRALGYPYPALPERGTDLYVARASVEYRASARYDDILDVCVRVSHLGRSSLRFQLEIHRGAELVAAGELVYVNVDLETRRAAPIAGVLREAVRAFELVPPTGAELTEAGASPPPPATGDPSAT
jgi:acyl-CoA thioester hydrolase